MGCFDPKSKDDVDKILKENNVEFHVEYVDAYKMECVYLVWKYGSWCLPYDKLHESAKQHAATFVYLWLKGVGLPLSDQLAYAYTRN